MSFNPDINVLKQNLEHWYKFDYLSPAQGIALLIGIQPVEESINALSNWYGDDRYIDDTEFIKTGIPLLNGDIIGGGENKIFRDRHSDKDYPHGYTYERAIITYEKRRFHELVEQYYQRLQYWNTGKHPEKLSLLYFIEWAVSKNIRPAWLDSAIEFGLCTPEQETIENIFTLASNSSTYLTKWLEIQQAAIAQFFDPRRNPDAKREEVIEWINAQAVSAGLGESRNIASSIFTIIKPTNHDPKKTRSEPQKGQ